MHPATYQEAIDTLTHCLNDLGLSDLPLHIEWFQDLAKDQPGARERFLGGDLNYFSDKKGLRGFISWTNVLSSGAVHVCADLHNAASTVAHELRHVFQVRFHGCEKEPKGAFFSELERDAQTYAAGIYEMVRARRTWQ